MSDPEGYRVVADLMMHGPCGNAKPSAPCMEDGTKGEFRLDNTYVVPYNRFLCLMFHAHINVEYCGWSMLIKYLFKYISKGTDRIAARITRPIGDPGTTSSVPKIQIDEIKNFIDGRFICPHEACWRILKFPIHHREPPVQILAVHRAACQALGLLEDDKEWDVALQEASLSASAAEIRTLFAHILIYCEVADPINLWEKHWRAMADDIPAKAVQNRSKILASHCLRHIYSLNLRTGFLRSEGKIVLAVASSGIASLLLPSGRTAHSRFKLPLELSDQSICNIKKNTMMAKLLAETQLIVWDEAPMNDRRCFEALDRTLKDILDNSDKLFGGKTIMLGGDFRQTLPVKKKGSRTEIINSSIAQSYLWPYFKVCKLKQNMRLLQNHLNEKEKTKVHQFSSWLLEIGDGKIGQPDESNPKDASWVTIPSEYLIPNDENGIQSLIDFIYDKETLENPTPQLLQEKAIVCPKNETAVGKDGAATEMLYPPEYLNTFKFPGLPPNILHLKIGAPIMLLRNVNLGGGLFKKYSNGWRNKILSTLNLIGV